jgi:hypothetical protein
MKKVMLIQFRILINEEKKISMFNSLPIAIGINFQFWQTLNIEH